LGVDESRETLSTWLETARHYFAQDDGYRWFVLSTTTWDRSQPDYGFAAEGEESRLHRSAPEMMDAFLRFCAAISSFFPYSFLSRKFLTTDSWDGIQQAVYTVYNKQLTAHSFMQYTDITQAPGENYYIFHERLRDHFVQHLTGPDVTADEFTTGDTGDILSCSHANLIAIFWLERIDRRLPQLVMKEYATDLRRTDAQLVSLVPRIAGDMDILLSKLADTRIQRVAPSQGAGQEDSRTVHAVPAGSQTPRLPSR